MESVKSTVAAIQIDQDNHCSDAAQEADEIRLRERLLTLIGFAEATSFPPAETNCTDFETMLDSFDFCSPAVLQDVVL